MIHSSIEYTYKDGNPLRPIHIKKKWNDWNIYAANRDSYMKFNISNFLNNLEFSTDIPELKQFEAFYEKEFIGKGLSPFRCDWKIIDIDSKISSIVDCVCKLPEGDFKLFKWVRSKKIVAVEEDVDTLPSEGTYAKQAL